MAGIDGIPEKRAGLLVRFAYWFARRQFKRLPEPLRIIAHHRQILLAAGSYEYWLQRAQRVDAKLLSLAQLKAGALVGCPW